MTLALFAAANPATQQQLLDIRHRAMVARPMRTVERIKSHLAMDLVHGPQQETADAITVLDKAWKRLYAESKGRRTA